MEIYFNDKQFVVNINSYVCATNSHIFYFFVESHTKLAAISRSAVSECVCGMCVACFKCMNAVFIFNFVFQLAKMKYCVIVKSHRSILLLISAIHMYAQHSTYEIRIATPGQVYLILDHIQFLNKKTIFLHNNYNCYIIVVCHHRSFFSLCVISSRYPFLL